MAELARGLRAAEDESEGESAPILREAEAQSRRRHAPGWVGLFGAVALFAVAAVGGSVVSRSRRAGQGAAASGAVPRTQFLAETLPALDSSVVATADQLTDQVDELKAKITSDKSHAEKIKKHADSELDDGTSRIKAAKDEIAAAKANVSKAQAMQREAELQLQKAKVMMEASKMHTEHANANTEKGHAEVSEAKSSSKHADGILDSVAEEKKHAKGVEGKEVDALYDKVGYLKDKSDADKKDADAASKSAQGKADAAASKMKGASKVIDAAEKNISHAADMVAKANRDIGKAKEMEESSTRELKLAGSSKEQGYKELAAGKKAAAKAKAAQQDVDAETAEVAKIEEKALRTSASHRICVDMPGVRLQQVGKADDFAPIAAKKDVSTVEKCRAWCTEHEDCKQMIFSSGDKGCYLFSKATTQVSAWRDEHNSSFCGDEKQKPHLMKMLKDVYAQKPTTPPVVQCSWAGDDCSKTKCCNDVACTWDFKDCKSYSCYQDDDSAQCKETAGWNKGTVIGGARAVRKVEASKGVTLQGTSLFCFMVVNWKGDEGAIANNIKEKKLSIYQCDAHAILSGWETPKTPWSSLINADAFVKLWQQLQQDKVYLQHDWTVKVDADTVFFPSVLKLHLAALKTPQGSRVYVKNTDYKFQFMGALEVLTREAVELYFEKGGQCAGKLLKAHAKAGEDFYMKSCLDAIGVDSQEDFKVLRDASCGDDCGGSKGPCSDGWLAAYHFYRDVDAWNTCHSEALKAQAAAPKPDSSGSAVVEANIPAVESKGAAEARSLLNKAEGLKAKARPDAAVAKDMNESAWTRIDAAHAKVHTAKQQISEAKTNMSEARVLEHEAAQKISDAKALSEASKDTLHAAQATKKEGAQESDAAKALLAEAKVAKKKADAEKDMAANAEDKALQDMGDLRVCVDLPGVRLTGNKPLNLTPIATTMDTHTPELCSSFCRKNEKCKQSIYSAGNKGCYFFAEASDMPVAFSDKFNSSYCGGWHENEAMVAMLNKVFKMKPYVPPVRQCTWAGDNCLSTQCCANVPVPNWKFTEFQWYTCFKKDETFAGCHLGPAPGTWDGTRLGGMGTREVPKAPKGVLVQGTSLFCFAVVMWNNPPKEAFWSSEAELANNIKTTGRSIYQCDDHAFFEGSALGGGDSSSINNIDSFIGAWNKVRDDGRYLKHDWTVKVDCDAVFFPDRLKHHLWDLRTPQGSRVYLKNINFKFQFLGALEIFTKEALEHYFDKSGDCAGKVGHQGGEDYFMEACMDGIGIDHQTDFKLLNDKYAATGNCNDPWVVGFHFYKKVTSWNACHDAAVNAAKNANMDFN